MSATIQLMLLDQWVLDRLGEIQVNDTAVKVGDMKIPEGAGWSGSAPGAPGSAFIPYVVMFPGTAGPAPNTGSFSTPQADWHIPYAFSFIGESREQMRWMADQARAIFSGLSGTEVALEATYKLQQVWTQQIGAPQRNQSTKPEFYEETDQVTLWLAKRRA